MAAFVVGAPVSSSEGDAYSVRRIPTLSAHGLYDKHSLSGLTLSFERAGQGAQLGADTTVVRTRFGHRSNGILTAVDRLGITLQTAIGRRSCTLVV